MNKLPLEKRVQILSHAVRGLVHAFDLAGCGCFDQHRHKAVGGRWRSVAPAFHDQKVRDVKAKRVQCDEIWSFSYAKQKNVPAAKAAPVGAGNVWTWTASTPTQS